MSETASTAAGRAGLPTWITLGWPLVVAIATVYVLDQRTAAQLDAMNAARPPVAVINEIAFVQKAGSAQAGMSQAATTAAALRERGYLVIERGQVMAVPEGLEVRP